MQTEEQKERKRIWYQNNKAKRLKQVKEWRLNNKERVKGYYQNNKESIKKYQEDNKERINKNQLKHTQEDIGFKIARNSRIRLYHAIKNSQKVGSAVKDLQCSVSFFKSFTENKFYPHPHTGAQMTWKNWGKGYGKWQIDHIEELHTVDLTNREEFLRVVNYTNMQPLWYCDHIKKEKIRDEDGR